MQQKMMQQQIMKLLTRERLLSYSHVFWDWNGTILNDMECCMSIENEMLVKQGKKPIGSLEEYRSIFGFPIIDFYKKMGFDLEKYKFEDLSQVFISAYEKKVLECNLYNYSKEIFEIFRNNGVKQIILSASEVNKLHRDVEYFKVNKYFHEILGISDIYAKSKAHIGIEYVNKNNPKKALFIGDTIHDFEVAQLMGIDALLVADGHQGYEILKGTGAMVIENLEELYNIISTK